MKRQVRIEAPTLLGLAGYALLVGGIALLSVPAALMVAGVLLLALAILAALRGG